MCQHADGGYGEGKGTILKTRALLLKRIGLLIGRAVPAHVWSYGLQVTRLVMAAYLSHERGRVVDLRDPATAEELESYVASDEIRVEFDPTEESPDRPRRVTCQGGMMRYYVVASPDDPDASLERRTVWFHLPTRPASGAVIGPPTRRSVLKSAHTQ